MSTLPEQNYQATAHPFLKRHGLQVLVALGVATIFVAAMGSQRYVMAVMLDRIEIQWWRGFVWPAVWWSIWVLLAPLVLYAVRRLPLSRDTWKRTLLLHVAINVGVYAVHVGLQIASMFLPYYIHLHDTVAEMLYFHFFSSILSIIATYWFILAGGYLLNYSHQARIRDVRASRLESELSKAQLHALKAQLQPHFLFNTLHAISALMYVDVKAADRMLAQLSVLLRQTIEQMFVQEIPLREEIAFLEKYLEIEQARIGHRLQVTIDTDEALGDLLVPTLILQPLGENAIKHGIAPRTKPGHLTVRAIQDAQQLRLTVADDGVGLPEGAQPTHGTGLANTLARLYQLYGDDQHVTFRPNAPSGFVVELVLPLRPAPRTERPAFVPARTR